jgi:hypothetical protein
MARQVARLNTKSGKAKFPAKKAKLPKPKWIYHSWRCAFSSSSKCCCSCGNKFHGTGKTSIRG